MMFEQFKKRSAAKRHQVNLAGVPTRDVAFLLGSLLHVFPGDTPESIEKLERIFFDELKTRMERRQSLTHEFDLSTNTRAEVIFVAMLLRETLDGLAETNPALHAVMSKITETLRAAGRSTSTYEAHHAT